MALDASWASGYNEGITVKDCNEMLPTVTRYLSYLGIFCAVLLGLSAAAEAQAMSPLRVYASPALPVQLYQDFQREVKHSRFEQLEHNSDLQLVLRLQDYSIREHQPFYWARTRMDSREIVLKAQIKLEIWRESSLIWQESLSQQRHLRATGSELRGIGQDILLRLSQSPGGVLNTLPAHSQRDQQLRLALMRSILKQLKHTAIEQLNLEKAS